MFQRRTVYEPRVHIWHSMFGEEYHEVYLFATERPGNRVPRQTPRHQRIRRPVRQPGMDRKGRFQ